MNTIDFHNMVDKAKEAGQLLSFYADELKGIPFTNPDDQEQAFKDFQYYLLMTRIHKGAEYIESIDKEHPHYQAAMKKYDDLVKKAEELRCQD